MWSEQATPVSDHDFRSQGIGRAIPFGVYDPVRNAGSVFVGTSHDTPQFAAQNTARWWQGSGRNHHPRLNEFIEVDMLGLTDTNNWRKCAFDIALLPEGPTRFRFSPNMEKQLKKCAI